MAIFADCMACREGLHEYHVDVPGPVPEGVMGGHICPCKGDCAQRNRHIDGRIPSMEAAPVLTPEVVAALKLLEELSS
jgi:hypothetical protein